VKQIIFVFLPFFLLFQAATSNAQRFGGNPPSLKWKQLETEQVKVIFPPARVAEAQRLANVVSTMERYPKGSLGNIHNKIPIVLHALPLVSNAYVSLGPWRSEFFLNPLQNSLYLGSTSWIDNLSTHEYRHVQQYSNFRRGISKFLYLLAGQEGQSLANAMTIPDWFFEGDAVYTETEYLSQGRGRIPYFFDAFNSIWTANKKYSYQKLRSGSMKDVVPDHYQLGYMLVAYGNRKYGDTFWGKITQDAAKFKGIVYPFQKAIKRYTGLRYSQFVKDAITAFKEQLPPATNIDSELALTKQNKQRVVNYSFPVWIGKDSVLALRKPYNQLPHWVLIDSQHSKRLGLKFIGIDDYFNFKNGKIIYTAYSTDARWDWKEFNDVYVFNLADRSTSRVTIQQRLFSPDLSHDGSTIVAIKMPVEGGSALQFWDATAKKSIKTIAHPTNYLLSHPVFDEKDQLVYLIARKPNGESTVLAFNRMTESFTELFPFVQAPIAFLRIAKNQLLFTVTQSGKNEMWKYHLSEKSFSLLSSSNTGSYVGDIDEANGKIIYSRPTAEGDQLFTGRIPSEKTTVNTLKPLSLVYPIQPESERGIKKVGDSVYEVSSYSASTKLINIHSWRPYYENPNWSFTLYGQNVLNTFQSSYQYQFNQNEHSHQFGAYGTYGALYPWVVGGTNYTFNRNFKDSTRDIKWNEWNGNLGLRIPLSNNGGRFFRSLDLSSTLNNVVYNYDAASKPATKDKFISYLHLQLVASMLSQQATQQINPRFGWVINLQHRTSVGKTEATQSYGGARIYLPGLMRTHSFNISGAYQARDTLRQYVYSNNFAMARGYTGLNYPRMWRFSFNYHLPLMYPDLGIGNIVYFRRIRTNLFYDDMFLKSLRTGKTLELRSTGVELHFDTKWWNQQPVSFGIRYSRLLDTKKFINPPNVNQWEFIMPVNLIPN